VSVPPEPSGPFEDQPTQQLFTKAPAATPTVPAVDETADEGDLLDEDWDQPRRYSRLTVALAIGILVVLAFAGGAFVAGALRGPADALCTPPGGPPAAASGS
jgi:hypothetical protein